MNTKEEYIKDILSMRRRLNKVPTDVNRDMDRFEDYMTKALKRVDKVGYLSAKFTLEELRATQKAYSELL